MVAEKKPDEQEKMDLVELFGLHAMGKDEPEDYIRWAERQVSNGHDSEDFLILAGMDTPKPIDKYEVYHYFKRCLRILDVTWPDPLKSIYLYSEQLCVKVLNN